MIEELGQESFSEKICNLALEARGSSFMSLNVHLSHTTWQSISRCFVRSWKTKIEAMCCVLFLSQQRTACLVQWTWRSSSRNLSHWRSQEPVAKAHYSSSAEEEATVACFDFQLNRESPRKEAITTYWMPCVWETRPISITKPRIWSTEVWGNRILLSELPFKYFKNFLGCFVMQHGEKW